MGQIHIVKTPIEGLVVVEPMIHSDSRGFFYETYNKRDMLEAGLDMNFVQDNHSMSVKGTLRGLHFQSEHSQGKLVRVIKGTVFDVAVDLRTESHTFGKWYGIELSSKNRNQMYIPERFAHGFVVLSEKAEFEFKVTNHYYPNEEVAIAWNDPDIGIDWHGVTGEYNGTSDGEGYTVNGVPIILSEKDKRQPRFKEVFKEYFEKNTTRL